MAEAVHKKVPRDELLTKHEVIILENASAQYRSYVYNTEWRASEKAAVLASLEMALHKVRRLTP